MATRSSAYLINTGVPGTDQPRWLGAVLYRAPAAVSIPCNAMFISKGLTTPPCGVPSSDGANSPSSITPAASHLAMRPLAGKPCR